MKKKKLEQTWENLRWVNRVLEENRVEWRREMKEQKQVTRKEKKRKYKKKEQFRKELDQIRTSIYNLQQIPEMEEPEDRPDGWKEEEKHPEGKAPPSSTPCHETGEKSSTPPPDGGENIPDRE